MDLALAGRRAVVTGGSLGIGKAIARELASEGVSVAIVARDAARLEQAARDLAADTGASVVAIPADLSTAEAVDTAMERCVEALGGIDILVNNAGATPMGRIGDTTDATWAKSINLKLMGYARCARALTPAMRQRRWGRVINIIGRSGHQPRANYIVGSSVNASLLALTHALAQECAGDNVLVTGVNPGPIQTPRWDMLTAQGGADMGRSPEAENQAAVESTALRRLGTPEEVAGLVAFLCSERASYITGTMIDVDGGGTRCI